MKNKQKKQWFDSMMDLCVACPVVVLLGYRNQTKPVEDGWMNVTPPVSWFVLRPGSSSSLLSSPPAPSSASPSQTSAPLATVKHSITHCTSTYAPLIS